MPDTDTTIRIKRDTWRRLRDRKGPGESFDEVLTEILDDADPVQSGSAAQADS